MNEAEFVDALDRFGADLSHWPDAQALSARALLASSDAARQRLDDALAFSRLLDEALPVEELSLPRFSATMLERIGRRHSLWSRAAEWMADGLTWPRAWRPAVIALVPLLLGFTLGATLPEDDAPDAEMVDVVSLYALSETTFEDYQDAQ